MPFEEFARKKVLNFKSEQSYLVKLVYSDAKEGLISYGSNDSLEVWS